jgi:hypothetical protein
MVVADQARRLAARAGPAQENHVSKTTTVRGTIRKIGIEGGIYALITDEGKQIELIDPPAELQKNGTKAEVVLDRKNAEVTIGMIGDAGRVKSFKLV